jgi:hypothetical protein
MLGSKLAVRAFATLTFLSTGFVLYPQSDANARPHVFCAQLRGATAAGKPDWFIRWKRVARA